MAQVNVTISGKVYRMACDDGQEEHLAGLANQVNTTIETLRQSFGEIGDQRLTVMAAITVMDRLSETEKRLKALEKDVAALKADEAAVVERYESAGDAVAHAIGAAAEQIEALARRVADGSAK